MLPQKVHEGHSNDGYGHLAYNRLVHVSRPAIRENMRSGKKHPTCVVIDENGDTHLYHAVKVDGFLGFDPTFDPANVYLHTTEPILCYLDPEGDPPLKVEVPEKPKTIAAVIWDNLMGFRRRTRHGIYAFFWGVSHLPVLNCLIEPGEYQPYQPVAQKKEEKATIRRSIC